MRPIVLAAISIFAIASPAAAKIPTLNATCPTGIEVHADEGGPIYINGQEAKLKVFNDNAYDASHGGVTISLTIAPDGTADVAYTGKGGANGICQVVETSSDGGGCPVDVSEADRYKYPACN